ncbi:MAG: type IX secretion system outer membrane channel protein PorV [Bacteroidia bacterium]|nr:type IX secretion system outer membrane channel protein PorV [Bacteroidia bacterium]MCC6768974.1 type IX secretion system outer membrane channel protein PorV [Bacteroidia bacterium]
MHKRALYGLPLAAILLLSATQANAQITTNDLTAGTINTITTAVPLLMISPDARAGAMGDAGGALSPDANSVHWAAAKLADIEGNAGVSLSYIPWLRNLVPDINLGYLSWYKKLKKRQTIGGSLRYFSLGNIIFTDIVGNTVGQFNPNEFAVDVAYARKFSNRWSGGLALRYIFSNLTGSIDVQGTPSFPGQAVAADISTYYTDNTLKLGGKKSTYAFALAITNIGNRISYTKTADRNFIPINLRVGNALKMKIDDYNSITFTFDVNKLLVPTPPRRDPNDNTKILQGKENNVPVVTGMLQSFYDAPGVLRADGTYNVFKEELREINPSGGVEYNYNNVFMVRGGYFHEHATKGNRRYFTLGAGLKFNVFTLDLAYLIPTQQRNPLERTLRFTLQFDFGAFQAQNKE